MRPIRRVAQLFGISLWFSPTSAADDLAGNRFVVLQAVVGAGTNTA